MTHVTSRESGDVGLVIPIKEERITFLVCCAFDNKCDREHTRATPTLILSVPVVPTTRL